MSVYFYVLVYVLASCSAMVVADECFPLNATFSVTPRICYPTYSISELYAQNSTEGDRLSSFLITLSNAYNLPSQECAEAFSTFYCSQSYPECAAGTTKPACATTCSAFVAACANYTSLFSGTEFPIPTQSECDALATTDCSATAETNLTAFYTDCVGNYNTSLVPDIQTPVCQPTYTIPVANFTYETGKDIFVSLRTWIQNYMVGHEEDPNPPNWMYPCIQVFANFWCATAYPECPENGALQNILPVCRSECQYILDYCNESITAYFDPNDANGYVIPTTSFCNALPDSPGVDCFIPPGGNNNTNVGFFFGSDPPSNQTVTPAPTPSPTGRSSTTGIEYPPGGAATGGGIGAAVLVAILGLIGILMLIMKKQDSR